MGLFPGGVLRLAGPALVRLTSAGMAERAGLLVVSPHTGMPGYSALGIAFLLAAAGGLTAGLVHRRADAGHRVAPAWDCGYDPPPAWLPFGDPLTQYAGASFSQPLRRVLGALLGAREQVTAAAPGDSRPARLAVTLADPAERGLHQPLAAAGRRLGDLADRIPPLTVRRGLALMFAALVLFLLAVATVEQFG